MLFDLRGRGRRRTVQAVYLGLAVLMGGGLVLFGVGAGNGFGGILNAFTGNGSSEPEAGGQPAGEGRARPDPTDTPTTRQRGRALVQARWTSAGQGSNFNTTTGTFTDAGKKELNGDRPRPGSGT